MINYHGNERLKIVNSIITEYLADVKISQVKYIENNLYKISEPFQFMSILYAKLSHIKNKNTVIFNPI